MTEYAIIAITAVTVPYVFMVLLVSYLARDLEPKLIVIGLFTCIAAVAYAGLLGDVGMHVNADGAAVNVGTAAGLPGTLMKVGVILVLAGVGVAVLSKLGNPSKTTGE